MFSLRFEKRQSFNEQEKGRSAMWLWLGPPGSCMCTESTAQHSCQSSSMEKVFSSGSTCCDFLSGLSDMKKTSTVSALPSPPCWSLHNWGTSCGVRIFTGCAWTKGSVNTDTVKLTIYESPVWVHKLAWMYYLGRNKHFMIHGSQRFDFSLTQAKSRFFFSFANSSEANSSWHHGNRVSRLLLETGCEGE